MRGRDRRRGRHGAAVLAAVVAVLASARALAIAAIAGRRAADGKAAKCLGLVIDERHGRAGDDVAEELVASVVVYRLRVVGNVDGDGTGEAGGDDTVLEGEREREGHTTNEHLARERL